MGLLSTLSAASARAYGFTRSAVAAAVDAYFNRVTLLLNTSSTNGAQNNTFLDSSTNNFTITRNGNTTQGTFTPFSQTGWSNYFNGSNSYLSLSSGITFGTSDYTLEFFAYKTSSWTDGFDFLDAATSGLALYVSAGTMAVTKQNTAGTAITLGSLTSLSANTWYHFAIVRSGGSVRCYVNGSPLQASVSDANNYSVATTKISGTSDGYFDGYISNMRLATAALYSISGSTITVPTSPLTTTTGVQYLGSQSNRFVDTTGTQTVAIGGGSPSVQAFSPFAPTAAYSTSVVGGSGYFDGTGDYLNSTITAVSDFTVECWAYFTTAASKTILTIGDGSATSGFELYTNSASYIVMGNATGSVSTNPTTLKANQWYHFAATRSGSTITAYVNGVSIGTANMGSTTLATTIRVGVEFYSSTLAQYFTGYIGSLRVSNTVRTGLTTLPTAPYTSDANTVYLLNYTNAGIYDSTAKNDLETVGNAQVSTTQAKWGTTSISFNGTNSILQAPASSMYDFGSGDFTIELWTKGSNSASTAGALLIGVLSGGGATNTNWGLFKDAPTQGYIIFYASDGTTYQISGIGGAATLNDGSWHHVAVTRSGSSFKVFVDGTQVGSTGTYSGSISSTARPLKLGYNGTAEYLNGYLDDVRITKGYARYTANFTPPTAAFPLN
jgi:hypothetical protein